MVVPPVTHGRLNGHTEITFDKMNTLRDSLPKGTRLQSLNGLKNGETWLIAHSGGRCFWHVVDAFGAQSNSEGKVGRKIRASTIFPSFGIKDRPMYLTHLKALLASDPPDMTLPCHRALTVAADTPNQIAKIYPDLNEA